MNTLAEAEDAESAAFAQVSTLKAALLAVLADIADYERINNLVPNPGKADCWQSGTNARDCLAALDQKETT